MNEIRAKMIEHHKSQTEMLVDQLGFDGYIAPVSLPDPLDVRADVDMIYRLYDLQKLVRFFGQRYWEEETLELGPVPGRLELENVAAHSFNVARCVPLLAPHFPWIDRARAIELALVHDEPEIVTGDKDPVGKDGQGSDTHAFNLTRRLDKDREERRALDALASSMRRSLRESYRTMFEELIEGSSDEAQFVKALDKLQALVFVRLRKGGRITPDHAAFTIRYSRIGVHRFPPLQEHFKLVLRDLLDDVAQSKPTEIPAFCEEAFAKLKGADQL
ncbi:MULTISPECIES: HD domain-containing protein [unclassified Rhizobium]|uniref:HD domain-containing protein n=1 Tax=unclassified Rhizobium TaxID=2613769 RepID=UPI00161B7DC5|nr:MULTISPECIES: HD domain-containing protein [unclassified Rhizobium]MBB3387214.1 5'-deoxynucleotidase YfbR-like HD superfamily hydrolase [Rhizobium sp. BK098]MBB3618923.1 5'-deoxynucleotidase YfbR-like HD superfamily hydrolase [Rhizobium sp. BK609]MBB3684579.1 5'-deoxynucleotidase YfbR-like HD superfamily hydrolase [Rhizobium sp. BK612]